MKQQKELNNIGIVYLVLLLGNILVCAGGFFLKNLGVKVPMTLMTILCELFIMGPVIIYIKSKNESITESLGFHKVKFTTILLTILLTIVVTPIFMCVNLISQLFVSNTVVQTTNEMIDGSIIMTIIATSVIAPLFEEATFRGFFYNGIKDRSSVLKGAIVSAILFGMMHLNLNQFCYAAVLGFIFALANQASGSTWTSVIMHFLINIINVVQLIIAALSMREQGVDVSQAAEAIRIDKAVMLNAVRSYSIISLVCVVFVWLLLRAIAKNQGNLDSFKAAFRGKRAEGSDTFEHARSVLNVPMLASLFIGVAAMVVLQITVL
ncbi:CPBP family intramembrane glutamic endopeptidase [Butyrivibrio sp. VCD2006]|uniref:CPBP family intramembrane glutamic endopeptidase n=1 Tax=Butyrivibrio sp. VCD2006 TaxID=1280664 RepID=UPI0003FC40F8|nr:type II CAAX endopeptidase family protein [Butyrivibrio sp. VCD2006]